MARPHAGARLDEHDRVDIAGGCQPQAAAAVTGADVEQRSASLWNERRDQPVDAVEVEAAAFRDLVVRRRDQVVGGHRIADHRLTHGPLTHDSSQSLRGPEFLHAHAAVADELVCIILR